MSGMQPAPPKEVPGLTEHLFRHESGRLVSMLAGILGIERLQMAEDVVQEALVRALRTWPYGGVPDNPAGWIMQTAKRLALDLIRREKWFQDRLPEITTSLEQWGAATSGEAPQFEDELKDDRLRLMFACCHPLIPQDSQAALALKTLCGFSPAEISQAFITTEAAVAKRLTRARQKIKEQGIPFEIPAGGELGVRLDGVLHITYLLFNEGYKASSGDSLVREDLCFEAIRLATLLVEHPATRTPRTHALLALMLLNAARLPARVDMDGNILRLQDQDRSVWNRSMIVKGVRHLALSASGDEMSEYHLQAGIAACHGTAPDYDSTNWPRILEHYDRWMEINPSPVVALNRAVAVAKVQGPLAGMAAVDAIPDRTQLESYYLVYAVRGELEAQLRRFEAAAGHFQRALELAAIKSEQDFLSRKVAECENEEAQAAQR